jgi:flagellar protein FlaG
MEVRSIGQGGQQAVDINRSTEKISQTNGVQASEKYKVSDNKNIQAKELTEKELEHAVEKLNKFLEDNRTHAEYEIHDKLNDIMIKIIDDKSGEVIQEIPSKKILDTVAKMMEMVGVLFDKKA